MFISPVPDRQFMLIYFSLCTHIFYKCFTMEHYISHWVFSYPSLITVKFMRWPVESTFYHDFGCSLNSLRKTFHRFRRFKELEHMCCMQEIPDLMPVDSLSPEHCQGWSLSTSQKHPLTTLGIANTKQLYVYGYMFVSVNSKQRENDIDCTFNHDNLCHKHKLLIIWRIGLHILFAIFTTTLQNE